MASKRKLTIEVAISSRKALAGGRPVVNILNRIGKEGIFAAEGGKLLRNALLGLGAGAVLGGIYAVNKALDATIDSIARASQQYASFGQELRNVGAVSGATREQIAELSEEALRLASQTRFSPDQTVQALYNLASAGFAVEEQLAALPSVLDFAEAAQADLGLSSELVTRNLKAFRLEATESSRVADTLTAAIGASALNAQRLSVGMAQAAPASGVLGQSLETTTAALAILVDQMGSGEMAGAGLKQALLSLMDSADDLDIKVVGTGGKFRDLIDIIRDLETAGAQGEQILAELGTRAGPAMSILVQQGSDALATMRDRVTSTGQAAAVAGEQLDTLQGDLDIYQSAIDEFWISYGQQLESGTRRLAQTNTAVIQAATEAIRQHGDDVEVAWVTSVEVMIEATRRFAIVVARVTDNIGRMGIRISDTLQSLSALPGLRELNDFMNAFVLLSGALDATKSSAGPAESSVRRFFRELERGGVETAEATDELKEMREELKRVGIEAGNLGNLDELNAILSGFDADIISRLGQLGIDADNLRDVEELNRILGELALTETRMEVSGENRRATLESQLSVLEKQREELERQFRTRREIRDEARRQLEIDQQILDAFEELSGITAPTGVVGDIPQIDTDPFIEAILNREEDVAEMMERAGIQGYEEWAKSRDIEELNAFIAENLTKGIQGALATGLSEFFRTGELEFEDFFNTIGNLAADIIGEAVAAELTKRMRASMEEGGGGLGNLFSGAGGTALAVLNTASIVAAADNQGYAAAGAVVGTVIGAYLGGLASTGFGTSTGAAWGAQIGAWIGSMIKHGAPEFYGEIAEAFGELEIVTAEGIGGGSAKIGEGVGKTVIAAVEEILLSLNAELLSIDPGIVLRQKEDWAVVLVDGIVHHFGKDWDAAVSFAVTEVLKRAEIGGISETLQQVLSQTKAESLEQLQQAFDFTDFYESLRIGETAHELENKLREFGASIRKALQFGLDLDPLNDWIASELDQYRNNILGIVETDEQRIRRQAEAFNAWVKITEAEQLLKQAELQSRATMLRSEVELLRAELTAKARGFEARLELRQLDLRAEEAMLSAEAQLLQEKLRILAAVEEALAITSGILEGLPDLISEQEIGQAIRNAGRGTGPTEADREAARRAAEGFGLTAMEQQLQQVRVFAERHMETIADLGFAEEELADIRRRATEEQQQMAHQFGREALAALGTTSVATIQRMQDLGVQLAFLRNNFEELDLTAGQLMRAVTELGQEITLSIASGLARYIDDADVRRQLQVLEHELFMNQKTIEINAARVMGLITEEQLNMLLEMLNLAREWEPPEVERTVVRTVSRSFNDARRDAERIAESFRRAKGSVAEFLNEILVGQFGGTSPVGGVVEATRQFDEVLRQALTGNIGAIENFDDYGRTLLRLAEEAYGSSPEFQAIRDYVLASGRDILQLRQGREGNLVFDERFYANSEAQLSAQRQMADLLTRIERHLRDGGDRRIVRGAVN